MSIYEKNKTDAVIEVELFVSEQQHPIFAPPTVFLSHNSSDTQGLAPLMNVLFWGRCDLPISFSGRDM